MPSNNAKRIQILTPDEIDTIYQRPILSQAEKEEYFSIDETILGVLNTMGKLETKLYFILLIGYFRAKAVVPKFGLREAKKDVEYIRDTYFPGKKFQFNTLAESTRLKLVEKMLKILDFQRFTKEHQQNLMDRLQDVATIYSDPQYIFDECLAFFGQKRIALPGYSTIQKLITKVLSAERQRTEQILSENMSDVTAGKLKEILGKKGALNSLSGYRSSAKSFSHSELDRELHSHQTIKEIYPELKSLMNILNLSQGNMAYYASIIKHCSIYKIRRYPKWQGLLYLACYLFHRYREANDKLVTAFSYLTRTYNEEAKAFAKQEIAQELETIRGKLKSAGNILHYFVDDKLSDDLSFGEVRQRAFSLIPKEDISMISRHLDDSCFDLAGYQWCYIEENARKIALSLRKLFRAIDIEVDPSQAALTRQITTTKEELRQNCPFVSMDQRLIRKNDHPYLVKEGKANKKRFEFYLYHRISTLLESDKIYVTESVKNKRLEDDLIPADDWRENKEKIIQKTGLSRLLNPISETLDGLENELIQRLEKVTDGINSDANEFVKHQPHSDQLAWSLANRRWKTEVDNPIYKQIKHLGIIEIMNYVNQQTGYLDAFEGITSRKHNIQATEEDLIACIFGNGANYGLHRIAAVSDRSIGALRSVSDTYIRPETISAANDMISDAIGRLPIFKYYTINETAPFCSIDGQKHTCRINTFKARYSAKYFRKGQGVSAMTMVSNHVPVRTLMISPNEYEGHFAFDLLYNNTSEIKPKSLATDTHGTNNVNFAILDLFGYQFSPRYAKFKRVFNDHFEIIFGDKLKIKLKKPFKRKLMEQEWDAIQHIICSLSRKSTNQSTVIKKLSSNKRNSRTLAALREYDRMIKCLYLLEYIDNKTLRHFVQKALNRGEAYHQLRKAIASVNGNEFRGGDDYQIEQWNDCARLIANCIIYYNSALLSVLVEKFEKTNDQKAIEMIAGLSPVAWRHIQLAGNYIFGNQGALLNLYRILESVDPFAKDPEENQTTA